MVDEVLGDAEHRLRVVRLDSPTKHRHVDGEDPYKQRNSDTPVCPH